MCFRNGAGILLTVLTLCWALKESSRERETRSQKASRNKLPQRERDPGKDNTEGNFVKATINIHSKSYLEITP